MNGLIGASKDHDFGRLFKDYITDNWAQTVAITSITFIITLAITIIANPTAFCFKEGTLVETEDGLKPIEEIKEGDLVLAFDEQTGEQSFKPVVQLFRNTTDKWYHITANGEEIICTAEHPFYVVDLGFVPAKNLSVNDKLLSSNNSVIEIDSITIETLSTPETTYNFEVADYHTYYVSESGVLVHNYCKHEMVAGDRDSWNAKVAVGGDINHDAGHAHIYWKRERIATVNGQGKVIAGRLDSKGMTFLKNNMDTIIDGIEYWYYLKP